MPDGFIFLNSRTRKVSSHLNFIAFEREKLLIKTGNAYTLLVLFSDAADLEKEVERAAKEKAARAKGKRDTTTSPGNFLSS